MTTPVYYKWLRANGSPPFGKGKWMQGRWRSVLGDLVPCANGLHLCREKDLLLHVSDRLWIAEPDLSEVVECDDKIIVRRARVVRRVETIDDCTLRLFACDCAERVVSLANHPACMAAIATARRYARGQAVANELDAARDAARDATRDATRDAARTAAWDVARKAQAKRLLQYIKHGEAAEAMPWETLTAASENDALRACH